MYGQVIASCHYCNRRTGRRTQHDLQLRFAAILMTENQIRQLLLNQCCQ